MVFGFDPRKLVEERKKLEQEKENDAVKKQQLADQERIDKENSLRRNSNFKDALDSATRAIREFRFLKNHGEDKYYDAKKSQDPNYRDPRDYTDTENKEYYRGEFQKMKGLFEGVTLDFKTLDTVWPEDLNENQKRLLSKKYKTVGEEYGETDKSEDHYSNQIVLASTKSEPEDLKPTIKWESSGRASDPFENEVGISESILGAMVSGGIKIPYGWANVSAMLMDWADKENVPFDQSRVAKLERWFDNTMFGTVMAWGEDRARESAIGHITEAMVQMYGNWKAVGTNAVRFTDEAIKMTTKAIKGVKSGKYVRTAKNNNLYEAAKTTKRLNSIGTGVRKFTAVAVGGGVAGALVYDTEDIGTFGDWFFDKGEYTALDRKKRGGSKEEATRMLYNKLKFGGEMGFPIIPAIFGLGKLGKIIYYGDKYNAYSNKWTERFIDKHLAKRFRARNQNPEEIFEAGQRMTGKEMSSQLLANDYLKSLDQVTKRISKYTQKASNASGMTDELSSWIVNTIRSGNLGVKNGKVVVTGYKKETLNKMMKSLTKDLKVKPDDAVALIDELIKVNGSWAEFMNTIFKGGNVTTKSLTEFVEHMSSRIRNNLTTQYRIFNDKGVRVLNEYAPSADVKKEVAQIFMKNASNSKTLHKLTKNQADEIVNLIIKNVELDPMTAKPVFRWPTYDPLADKKMITKNLAENITGGGKFKPDKEGGLIQTKSDLAAFNKLFGSYEQANNVIANVTTDLAGIAARDRFYNKLLDDSRRLEKMGEPALVYDDPLKASKAFNSAVSGEKIINTPLKLPQSLAEEVYTVPINGMWTTENIAHGLRYGAEVSLSRKNMPMWYQIAVMIPKGLVQAGKTVFGPFTHTRNFTSGAVTTIATGNIAIPPTEIIKAWRTAYRSIQPQILGKNRPGLKVAVDTSMPGKLRPGANTTDPNKLIAATEFVEEGGQSLYRFLLDEGMVNASATYRDLMGLIDDTSKAGFFDKVGKIMDAKLLKYFKKFGRKMQELYVAEDDVWKIFNFAAESYRIRRAYSNALKAGKIKMKDVPGGSLESVDILKMATKNVRDMLPNYNYVSEFVQGFRRAPLSNFVSWPSEIIRGSTNMLLKARSEIKDPILRRMGYERLGGMITAWATLPPLAVWGFSQLYGFTKEKLNALREFVPWFSADSTILPVYVDGQYKYIDFSRAYFYDTIINPAQAVLTEVATDTDHEALIPKLIDGFGKASARMAEPYVAPAIWVEGIIDIFARGGETEGGSQVFNPRDTFGNKLQDTIMHLSKKYAPGSLQQTVRLYSAIMGETYDGIQYEIPDEVLGFIGGRPAPLNLRKSMNVFINEFLLGNTRNERNLFLKTEYRTGDPVNQDDLLRSFMLANQQKYESMSAMRRKIDALKLLGWNDEKIEELFDRRGKRKIYQSLMNNEFVPFAVTDNAIKGFENLVLDQMEKGLEFKNPIDDRLLEQIDLMRQMMSGKALNQDWDLKVDPFLFNKPKKEEKPTGTIKWEQAKIQTPPLGKTPMPVVNNAQNIQQKDPITNLTRTEQALLSPSEKIIAGRT